MKTLYLWDVAGTIINEKWNKDITGFETFFDYVVSIGKDPNNPREAEEAYYIPYTHGEMFNLDIKDGFKETLTWTKNNEIFTQGTPEQMNWRAEYLNPKVGFDIRQFFQKINSTFDFGETNIKTKEMLSTYLNNKKKEGYETVVYTDDKIQNCMAFKDATDNIQNLKYRIYHIKNDNSGIIKKDQYYEIGNLLDLLKNEQQ